MSRSAVALLSLRQPRPTPHCECGRICGYCGDREADHVGEMKRCPDCEADCVFDSADSHTPDTFYVETLAASHWSPAEGVDVCERCHCER